jgi:hypothetical protein
MTGTQAPPRSQSPLNTSKNLLDNIILNPPNRTVMDAYMRSSFTKHEPEVTFGTSTRPSLTVPDGGPGPGAYQIKTTLGKVMESHIRTPSQFSIRGRTKFGDPNAKALSKTAANEPGYEFISFFLFDPLIPFVVSVFFISLISVCILRRPGQYDLTGKFLAGKDPRKTAFPKAVPFKDKNQLGPGPGSYQPLQSMGKQVISTKTGAMIVAFPKADRPSLVPPGSTDIGPAEYKPSPAACDIQVDSRKPTCSTIKFGEGYKVGSKDDKQLDLKEPAPG